MKVRDINELPLVLNIDNIANVLGVSRVTAYRLAGRDDFPKMRVGRAIRVPRGAFISWIDKQIYKPDNKVIK